VAITVIERTKVGNSVVYGDMVGFAKMANVPVPEHLQAGRIFATPFGKWRVMFDMVDGTPQAFLEKVEADESDYLVYEVPPEVERPKRRKAKV